MGKPRNGVRNGGHGGGSNGSASAHSKTKTNGVAAPQSPPSPPPSRFSIDLSIWFLLLTFALSTVVAFSIGWVARLVLLSHFGLHPYTDVTTNADKYGAEDEDATALALPKGGGMSQKSGLYEEQTMSGKKTTSPQLPAPKVIEGKDVPFTTYASKTFQMAGAATSNTLHIDRTDVLIMSRSKKEFDGGPDYQNDVGEDEDGWVPVPQSEAQCESNACSRGKEKKGGDDDEHVNTYDHNDDSDGLHLPAGQHLLVDIKDVDSNFLNSEERLATAMIELTNESKLTLLSYHCHSLVPIGVSCAGVLLESHVAFHTWPMEGVITMDLFTCGGGLLVPLLPSIEKLFSIPQVPEEGESEEDIVPPTMLWSHKLRGFREGFAPGYVRSKNALDGSLGRYVLGKLDFDLKRPLLSTKTAVQNVNIYEVMEPKNRDVNSYYRSLWPDGESYESSYPEYFGPDKVLFLDGVIQSTLYGDAPYHESIVHPAMIANSNPKRVAIIGGGEGATLREVLKYKSVEEVVILEIDQELVDICAEYMPEWSDCGDIEGSAVSSCFEDPRAKLIIVDAFRWFIEQFGNIGNDEGGAKFDAMNRKAGIKGEEKFDVIIMDALDPNTSVEIAGGLYNDTSFIDSMFNSLTEAGVFVVQMGKSKMNTDPPDEVGRFRDTGLMIKVLEKSGFGSIHTYDEGHSHFYMPWSYLVAFKEYKSRAGWHRTAPEIQIALQQRLHKTKSGKPILRYFDAATMVSYQLPSKAQENTYCRKEEEPWECDEFVGLHPEYVNLPADYLKVGKSNIGEHAGRGLFAAKDIPYSSSLALDQSSKAFYLSHLTWSVLEGLYDYGDEEEIIARIPYVEDELSGIYWFVDGYGHGAIYQGETHMSVESGVLLFMNHGCNDTNNYGWVDDENRDVRFTESNVDSNNLTEAMEELLNKAQVYSPVYERNMRHMLHNGDFALRDIKAGEEILTDYLAFAGDPGSWEEHMLDLRRQCNGDVVGSVTNYDSENQ